MSAVASSSPALAPTSIAEVQEAVMATPRLLPIGAGTKPALSAIPPKVTALELRGLDGIIEYQPDEYTFTALAGTPLRAITAALAEHGQYLPFDPPWVDGGATLGGAIAAGLSGAGRYRFGGLRDFIIGVRFVDGRGRLVRAGGKVVKNAAGFDLPKLLVGSLGRLGVIVEASFKVFPAPPAWATWRVQYPALGAALAALADLRRATLDLAALDLIPDGDAVDLAVRIGGPSAVLPTRMDSLRARLGQGIALMSDDDAAFWQASREFAWASTKAALVKVPISPHLVAALDAVLADHGAVRRYSSGASQAWIAWPGSPAALSSLLAAQRLSGLLLRSPEPDTRPLLGLDLDGALRARVLRALDPDRRFLPFQPEA